MVLGCRERQRARPCGCRRCHHQRLQWKVEAPPLAIQIQKAIPCGRRRCQSLRPALTEVVGPLGYRCLTTTPCERWCRFLFLARKVAGGQPAIRNQTMIPGGCRQHCRFPGRMEAGERFASLIRRGIRNGRHRRRLSLARTVVEERLASLILLAFPGDLRHHRYLFLVPTVVEERLAFPLLPAIPGDHGQRFRRRLAPRVVGGRLGWLRQRLIRQAWS